MQLTTRRIVAICNYQAARGEVVAVHDPKPIESLEDEIRNYKPPPPPSAVMKVTIFVYGAGAVGYAAFRLIVSFFGWATSRHIIVGVAGVLGLLCIGPFLVWLHGAQRRLFGGLELLASVSGAYYYSLKLSSGHDLGVFVSLTGAAFLFVKGFNDSRHG